MTRYLLCLLALGIVVGCSDDSETSDGLGGSGGAGGGDGGGTTSGSSDLVLDPSFGEEGALRLDRAESFDRAYAATATADGGIVVAGSNVVCKLLCETLVVKFDSDGAPDSSFGKDGVVVLPLADNAHATSVVAGDDNAVFVAGYLIDLDNQGGEAFVMKLSKTGEFDGSFADGGILRIATESTIARTLVARSSSGDIAVFTSLPTELSLRRYHVDGSVDVDFGTDGAISIQGNEAWGLSIAADGALLALSEGFLSKVDDDGTLVSTFGSGGALPLSLDARSLLVDSGTIWVGGTDARILKLDAAGQPDMAFGTNGTAQVPTLPSVGDIVGLAVDNGDIVAVGGQTANPLYSYPFGGLVRLDATGQPATFDGSVGGLLGNPSSLDDSVAAIGIVNGQLWVAGHRVFETATAPDLPSTELFATRLEMNGQVDAGYGEEGLAHKPSYTAPGAISQLLADDDGIIATSTYSTDTGVGVLARVREGSLDTSFGDEGFLEPYVVWTSVLNDRERERFVMGNGATAALFLLALDRAGACPGCEAFPATTPTFDADGTGLVVLTDSPPGTTFTTNLALDAEGRIVVTGGGVIGAEPGSLLARAMPDGSLDESFGDGGLVVNPAGVLNLTTAAVPTADGGIVFVGGVPASYSLGRVDETGEVDTSFGTNGATLLPGQQEAFRLIELASGGFATLGRDIGCTGGPTDCDLLVTRFSETGEVDTTFGDAGVVKVAAKAASILVGLGPAIIELPDGGFVIGASRRIDANTAPLTLWKLRPNGELDSTFGEGGIYSLPGVKGRATDALMTDEGLVVGGYATRAGSGSERVLVRFVAQ